MTSVAEKRFTIDPSDSGIKNESEELAEYLSDRDLCVDVYDADSFLHFGSVRVPLRELMRQNKASVFRGKDCEIASYE